MINITDLIVLSCSSLLVWRGALRGFLRSILGPICLILATLLSAYYFNVSKNLIVALAIGLFGPMALHFFLSNYIKLWHGATNPEWRPNPLSRIIGALLTLIWGLVFIGMTLILLTIIPPFAEPVKQISLGVRSSVSYGMIKPFISSATPIKTTTTSTATANTQDIAALAHDPRFATIMNDPEIQQAIETNDFAKLMSNPKIMALTQELMQDPDMLKKLMSMHEQLQPTLQIKKD